MVQSYIFTFVTVTSIIWKIALGLSCLSCHSESDRSRCFTHQVECRDGFEECFFDQTTLQNSAVVYTAGCRAKAVCDLLGNAVGKRDVVSRSRRTSVLCAQCCNTAPRNRIPCNALLCDDRLTPDTTTSSYFTNYKHTVSDNAYIQTSDCRDLINCHPYRKETICPDSSSYHPWASVRCRAYCGFCIVNTTPPPCVDKISNCNEYDADLCTNPLYRLFRDDNCEMFCGRCQPPVNTPPPCVDKISNCNEYDADLCTNPLYKLFVEDMCELFCGLCKRADSSATTPPGPIKRDYEEEENFFL